MKNGNLRRLLGYTFRYKWSFFISVLGFISFAFADIAAVEWIRRIIAPGRTYRCDSDLTHTPMFHRIWNYRILFK